MSPEARALVQVAVDMLRLREELVSLEQAAGRGDLAQRLSRCVDRTGQICEALRDAIEAHATMLEDALEAERLHPTE